MPDGGYHEMLQVSPVTDGSSWEQHGVPVKGRKCGQMYGIHVFAKLPFVSCVHGMHRPVRVLHPHGKNRLHPSMLHIYSP